MMRNVVDILPLEFRATVGAVDPSNRTVNLVFSTGADLVRTDYGGTRYIERLSLQPGHVRLDRLNSGAPLLNSHAAWSLGDQIGFVVDGSATVDGKVGRARVRFSRRPEVEPIFRDVVDKVIRNVSIGYRVHRVEETRGAGGGLPVRLATDWEPFEISLVPMGADAGAGVRHAAAGGLNACVIIDASTGRKDEAWEQACRLMLEAGQPGCVPEDVARLRRLAFAWWNVYESL